MEMICYKGFLITERHLFKKVINQLNKDLLYSGFSYRFSEKSTYDQFILEFLNWTENSILEKEVLFINFLYRADVKPQRFNKNKLVDKHKIAKIILEREFQKVIIRSELEQQ